MKLRLVLEHDPETKRWAAFFPELPGRAAGHKEFCHLFSRRYEALVVDGGGNGYLRTVCDYVHLNPVRSSVSP